ncbi:diguanylate cyclase (GGDEF)-like protein [Granulicella aggregans]|jgi:diguanylate cyclase (GGDEF)-like protein|uniref:diguanylate cyclase n=1 Tax=Granulicella aggregans TaxID=474949 RepID=A0A7W7Z9V5_9BACT|nr:GGDEF domain-containing protein [Granulicella aggregans]MBB5056019.1 diguanylate cyclase (GGDEF)-like protein [Granulicella aggregans]
MPSGHFALHRIVAIVLLAFSCSAHATPASIKSTATSPIVIKELGEGTFTLNGTWQFHPGDDTAWASPAFDSSAWEQLSADRPWGNQGHARLTGMAWYRCSIALVQAPGMAQEISLLVPKMHDSYEIYWNGSLVGRNGRLPPRPLWYISQPMQTFELGRVQQGVLAVRVWRRPLLSDDSGERGGFDGAPLIGSPDAIATAKAAYEYRWLRSRQLHFGANLLCAVIALLSFLIWLQARRRWVLFWTAGFAIVQPAILMLLNAHLGLPYPLAMGAAQPLHALQDISLWFLLLWLLSLHENRVICRVTQTLACIYTVFEVADGAMVALSLNPQWTALAQASDALLTFFTIPFEAFPLALVGYALLRRKRFDSARWLVAVLAFLDEMMLFFTDTVKQGRQFTGWPIADKIDLPLFYVDGNGISLGTLAGTLLLIAIVYAAYNSVREDQLRQDVLEREKLELLHESNRMRHHAEHDGLTGLLNHRVIVERLGEEMVRSLRDGTPLSVIIADVDHFKKVNDTFGHLAGDLVLKEIGTVFMRTLRPYDCVGRYGGEEFLLILPNCEIESALVRGEQLRAAVQSAHIWDGDTLLQVTASFGVASVLSSHDDAETVIRAVDAALYRAKNSGRNCVVHAEMETSFSEDQNESGLATPR